LQGRSGVQHLRIAVRPEGQPDVAVPHQSLRRSRSNTRRSEVRRGRVAEGVDVDDPTICILGWDTGRGQIPLEDPVDAGRHREYSLGPSDDRLPGPKLPDQVGTEGKRGRAGVQACLLR